MWILDPKPTITKDYFTPSYAFNSISSLLLVAPSFGVVFILYVAVVYVRTLMPYYYIIDIRTRDPIASQSTSFVRSDDCCIPIFIHDFSKAESRYPFLVFSFQFEYISIRVSSLMQQFLVFLIFGSL